MNKFFLKLKILLVCSIIVIFTNALCSASVLFRDTFDNVSELGDINTEYDNGRQSGSLAPIDYTVSGETVVGDIFAAVTNVVICYSGAQFAINYDFTDIGKNFVIEFDAQIVRVQSWAGFSLNLGGMDATTEPTPAGWWFQSDGNGPQYLEYGENVIEDRYQFLNSVIKQDLETEMCHIVNIFSTESFGGTDNVKAVMFANSEPTAGGNINGRHGTIFITESSFTNNYIRFGFEDGAHNTEYYIDNLTIRKTEPRIVVINSWTNDASSYIDSSKLYTHTVNIGHSGDTTINGVTFKGAGTDLVQAGSDWTLLNYRNNVDMGVGSETVPTVNGDSSNLISGYAYSRMVTSLIISNLTPGVAYTLSLYNNASDSTVDSYITPSDNESATTNVVQGSLNATIYRYNYIAPTNGVFAMCFNNIADDGDGNNNWRLYAFSNERSGSIEEPILSVIPTTINFNINVDDSTNVEILAKNIGIDTASGNITGISAPFSISTNWYSATPDTPYSLTATFSPTEEGNFTNVINFSGVGGHQNVTLIGEAVPECSLLFGFLTMAGLFIRKLCNEITCVLSHSYDKLR